MFLNVFSIISLLFVFNAHSAMEVDTVVNTKDPNQRGCVSKLSQLPYSKPVIRNGHMRVKVLIGNDNRVNLKVLAKSQFSPQTFYQENFVYAPTTVNTDWEIRVRGGVVRNVVKIQKAKNYIRIADTFQYSKGGFYPRPNEIVSIRESVFAMNREVAKLKVRPMYNAADPYIPKVLKHPFQINCQLKVVR
jgi:hypothetical protein